MTKIYYYSSTGNSLYVARSIAQRLGADVSVMQDSICGEEQIGFVFPAYFWGLPRSVETFLQQLKISNKKAYIFSIVTYGGSVVGVHNKVQQILSKKGCKLQYADKIKCVENYIPFYKIQDTESLFQKTEHRIAQIADALAQKQTKAKGWYSPFNHFVHAFYPGPESDALFQIWETCVGCSLCQKVCPAGNIKMQQGRPHFQHACDHCLGCLHQCPRQAIEWNHKTEGKERYRHRKISLADLKQNSAPLPLSEK